MVPTQEPHLVAPSADNRVEVVEYVPPQDAVIRRRRIGERGESALNADRPAIDRCKFQGRVYLDDGTCATDAVQVEPGRDSRGNQLAVPNEGFAEDRSIGACIDEEMFAVRLTVAPLDTDGDHGARFAILPLYPATRDFHKSVVLA